MAAALEVYGVALTADLAAAVRGYLELLLLWNRRVNLTSLRDPREILTRHFGESFFAARAISGAAGRLVDLGSGAGFPGLALKILRPQLSVTLIEPRRKKAVFLREVARRLSLSGVQVLESRFEEVSPQELAATVVTSRALALTGGLLEWCHAALCGGGSLLLWTTRSKAKSLPPAPGFEWREPLPIPNTMQGVLLIGRRGQS
jgi:16S rRNA (guanine527-N7)-methyltransferase